LRAIKISVVSIAILLVSIFLLSLTTSAVSSIVVTGHSENDYFKANRYYWMYRTDRYIDNQDPTDKHLAFLYGKYPDKILMRFQGNQPQHFIFLGHSNDEEIVLGVAPGPAESLYAWEWVNWEDRWQEPDPWNDGISPADDPDPYYQAPSLAYSAAPFTMMMRLGCGTGKYNPPYPEGTTNWRNLKNLLYPWIIVTTKGPTSDDSLGRFGYKYAYKIIRDNKCYKDALDAAQSYARKNKDRDKYAHPAEYFADYWKGSSFDHKGKYDRPGKMITERGNYHVLLDPGNSEYIELDLSSASVSDSNGAYAVFNCIVDDDILDLDIKAKIRAKVELRRNDNQWWTVSDITYSNVKNQKCQTPWDQTPSYGGSHIISAYIFPSELQTGTCNMIRFEITLVDDAGTTCDEINILQMEILEIEQR